MKHFGLEEWVDFSRDLLPEKRKQLMQQHLETGCANCGSVAQTWKRVYQMGRVDSSYEPPESVLRAVKGNFAIHGPQPQSSMPAMARLLFDSFASALPAGIRSGEGAARQLLYTTGRHEVDLRIEPQYDSARVLLVGQLLNSADPNQPVDKAIVALVAGKDTLAESVTNHLGEFSLDCKEEGSFQLRFDRQEEPPFSFQLPMFEL